MLRGEGMNAPKVTARDGSCVWESITRTVVKQSLVWRANSARHVLHKTVLCVSSHVSELEFL